MSAFIVSKPTMDHVVTTIDRHFNNCHRPTSFGGVSLTENGICYVTSELGRALYAMNLDAVTQRYPGDTEESAPGPCDISNIHENYRHQNRLGYYSKMVGLKSMRCLLYQCSEGNVPKTKLFKALETLANAIAWEIVNDLPEYEQAPWDAVA